MNWRVLNGVVLFAAATALTNCAVETNDSIAYKTSDFRNPNAKGGAGGGTSTPASTVALSTDCHPADGGEKLIARTVTHKGAESPTIKRIFVQDLFEQFRALCGGCHVDGNQGNWQISRKTFNLEAARESLLAMSNDRSLVKVMPPGSVGGELPQDRSATDPAVPLMEMLRSYIRATESGPRPYSYLEDFTSVGDASPYRMEPAIADALTPLGNCIPDKGLYATAAAKMKALDDLFFSAIPKYTGTLIEQIGLPADLKDTDLTTFDSRELAKQGVVAWTPNYPVFVDGARAIRHVRVPYGQSITFDKATQQFTIPDGTRFYKTYLKPVVELDGSLHFRKAETQLIVAFQDDKTATGYRAVMSLYGTYAWNEDETEAKLVTDPLRDGKAWRDHIVTYTSNEVEEDTWVKKSDTDGTDPGYRLIDNNAVHHFAIPGSRRCVECHQGSPSKNFVLGFQPLQTKRRKAGEGGVSEKDIPGADELTQLKRFVDYGLVKGLENENDIANLEDSELPRKPRTDQELRAQAYVMGACAHCHSDRGAATEYNTKLKGVFNLQPSTGQSGGIFEFPLDRYSESIFRGGSEHVQVPYITPSLFDRASTLTDGGLWRPKCQPKDYTIDCSDVCDLKDGGGSCIHWASACGTITYARNCRLAPWRSLIYRGVDTPFAYSDDLALFPKMPMHTPGFDCRAPQIMAEWMTSIPSIRLVSGDNEDIMGVTLSGSPFNPPPWPDSVFVDLSPQPYVEVKVGEPRFSEATSLAEIRLRAYRQEIKLSASGSASPLDFWPCDADIFDPNVLKDSTKNPVPVDKLVGGLPLDNIPNSGHWVIQDATLPPGDWAPRRADWRAVLKDKQYTSGTTDHEKLVISVLQSVTLSDNLQYFAYKKRPMTLWKKKTNCNFSGEPTVASYASNPPLWMASMVHGDTADTTQPVYRLSPGEYVNNLVCAHCHGPKGDATGREANTLLEMTGGNARVTNFLQGISIASNRAKVFGGLSSGSAEDWASRYFAWMGLGGTRTAIPSSIISLVATNDSMGQKRGNYVPPKDANMLSAPEDFCRWALPLDALVGDGGVAKYPTSIPLDNAVKLNPDRSPLIRFNGDQELWLQLCSIDNAHPVRAMHLEFKDDHGWSWVYKPDGALYSAADYPKTAPVMDHNGNVSIGIQDGNLSPWCLRQPATDAGKAAAEQWRQAHPIDKNTLVPYCPTCRDCRAGEPCTSVGDICTAKTLPYIVPLTADGESYSKSPGDPALARTDLDKWAIRGAVNAGLVAFEHFKTVAESASATITPGYDECEKLTP